MRIEPAMPAWAYTTYQIAAPTETHWRPATCAEVACPHYLGGWITRLPKGHDLIDVLRRSGRSYTQRDTPDGLVEFTFEPGQACFKASTHRKRTDRPELFVRRGGDWRGNPLGTDPLIHARPEHWVEDFALHQQQLADTIEKG